MRPAIHVGIVQNEDKTFTCMFTTETICRLKRAATLIEAKQECTIVIRDVIEINNKYLGKL